MPLTGRDVESICLDDVECFTRECKHFQGLHLNIQESNKMWFVNIVPFCKAFPLGIPEGIAFGDEKHAVHVEGDHGIIYERL